MRRVVTDLSGGMRRDEEGGDRSGLKEGGGMRRVVTDLG